MRFLTCGSVDDGKSTLIGRLLFDTQAMIYEDQLAAVKKDSAAKGQRARRAGSVAADRRACGRSGSRASRSTSPTATSPPLKRKFIIADTPGHEQYTRNMATGASTCDVAIILIDARHGVVRQTRRHSFIASLLGIRHVVVAINKMDLVGYSEEVFERIKEEYSGFCGEARAQRPAVHARVGAAWGQRGRAERQHALVPG